MRYYNIVITNPNSGQVVVPASLAALGVSGSTYTSLYNGATLTAALDVEIDAFVAPYATPSSDAGAYVGVLGVPLAEIAQSTDLNNFNIAVYGGFQKGLPLANPAQSGLLFSGFVQQCVGNWVGTDMVLSFYVFPGQNPAATKPLDLSFNWQPGTPFSSAVQATLHAAFPGYSISVDVSSSLAYPGGTQSGVYPDVQSFANYLESLTQPIVGGKYSGVQIVQSQKNIRVFDSTTTSSGSPTTILFQDMIGQPTWIAPATVQVKCPMRADVQVGNQIKFDPAGVVATTLPQSQSQTRDRSAFQGMFTASQIHHVGRLRSPSSDAWVTVIDAVQI